MGQIVKLTRPDFLPVTLDGAKDQLLITNVDAARDRRLLAHLLAATEYVQAYSGRLLARAQYAYIVDDWPIYRAVEIPAAPVLSVDEVSYFDEGHAAQIVADTNYTVELFPDRAHVIFNSEYSTPALTDRRTGRVTFVFTGGYADPAASGSGDDPELRLPDELRSAILIKTEALFESGALDSANHASLERTADLLIETQRIIRP